MKERQYKSGDIRLVLQGMVTDPVVCSRIASRWNEEGLFEGSWANQVARWCVDYLREYGSPPNGQLRGLFEDWASKNPDNTESIRMMEQFLSYLSDDFEQESPKASEYILDVAGRYFNRVRVQGVVDEASESLERNRAEEAYKSLTSLNRVELGTGSMIKVVEDSEMWLDSFDRDQDKQLLSYPGRLDNFLGSIMTREKLVAWMGPDKTGKSFWLLDGAYRAVRNRRRVAFFDVGDMVEREILCRLGSRVTRIPYMSKKIKLPTSVTWEGEVTIEEREFDRLLTGAGAYRGFKKLCRGRDLLRLSCHPNSTIDVDGIISILRDWEREGWVADVLVIDYADILAPPKGSEDGLEQIDVIWKGLRRISQELHCLVLTATQSNAAAYSAKGALGRQHFSGRKTKLAHVNGMIGINVSPEEKDLGVTRLNWVVKREGAFSNQRWMTVAGCLDISNPAVVVAGASPES